MTLEYLVNQIKKNQGRITPQREIILHHLIEYQQVLLTVDDLLRMCQIDNPSINMTTIYRNLELLEKLNLLYKINIAPTTSAYKLVCMEHHHHHMICKSCGKMTAIDYCPMSPELIDMAHRLGFTITEHNLEFYGICDSCNSTK